MSFPTMLYQFFLMPIQLVFEVIFSYAYMLTGEQAGIAIISLSLTMNLLVLPLYRRADALQEEERLTEARLHDGIAHIKKSFRGDERTMILQTYYRQNNYSPLYVLRSAVSLFLEIYSISQIQCMIMCSGVHWNGSRRQAKRLIFPAYFILGI